MSSNNVSKGIFCCYFPQRKWEWLFTFTVMHDMLTQDNPGLEALQEACTPASFSGLSSDQVTEGFGWVLKTSSNGDSRAVPDLCFPHGEKSSFSLIMKKKFLYIKSLCSLSSCLSSSKRDTAKEFASGHTRCYTNGFGFMRKKKIKKSQQNVETWVMSLKGTRHTGLSSDPTWTRLGLGLSVCPPSCQIWGSSLDICRLIISSGSSLSRAVICYLRHLPH